MPCEDGEWRIDRIIDQDILVLRCTSCKELKVAWHDQITSALPPNTTDEKIKELLGAE